MTTKPKGETTMALSPEARKRKYKHDVEYAASHTTRMPISFNNNTDADIIAYLKTIPNKQGLIKELIRARMTEEGYSYDPDN